MPTSFPRMTDALLEQLQHTAEAAMSPEGQALVEIKRAVPPEVLLSLVGEVRRVRRLPLLRPGVDDVLVRK